MYRTEPYKRVTYSINSTILLISDILMLHYKLESK